MSRRSRGSRLRRPPRVQPAPGTAPEASVPLAATDGQAPEDDQPPAAASVPAPRLNGGSARPGAAGCTAPQLRRFIKSRVYVPLHELRRRFAIDGTDDDVHPVQLDSGRVFVGLPAPEARLLEELLRGGDVGFELSRDPATPIVIGVYPMRPVARP